MVESPEEESVGVMARLKTAWNTLRGSLSGASESHYEKRMLDTNRSKGDRPYKHLSDEELKQRYVQSVGRVREADSGYGMSPVVDKGWNLKQEWKARGNDDEELTEALQEAGYDV